MRLKLESAIRPVLTALAMALLVVSSARAEDSTSEGSNAQPQAGSNQPPTSGVAPSRQPAQSGQPEPARQSVTSGQPVPSADLVAPSASQTPPDETGDNNQRKPLRLGVNQSSFNLGANESMLAWDKWHDRVGKALTKRVKGVTRMMTGFVAFDVLITKELSLTTTLSATTNKRMAEVSLEAVNSLSGDPLLQFPPETKRTVVGFRFEYKRGFVLLPKHQYITGDYEQLNDENRANDK